MSQTANTPRDLRAGELAARLQRVWLGHATLASLGEGGESVDKQWRALTDRVLTRKLDFCVSEAYDGARVDGLNRRLAGKYLSDDPGAAFLVSSFATDMLGGGQNELADGYGHFDFGDFQSLMLEEEEPLTAEVAEAITGARQRTSLFSRRDRKGALPAADAQARRAAVSKTAIQPYPARMGRAGATPRPKRALAAVGAAPNAESRLQGIAAGRSEPLVGLVEDALPAAMRVGRAESAAQKLASAFVRSEQVAHGARVTTRPLALESAMDDAAYASERGGSSSRVLDAVRETSAPAVAPRRRSLFSTDAPLRPGNTHAAVSAAGAPQRRAEAASQSARAARGPAVALDHARPSVVAAAGGLRRDAAAPSASRSAGGWQRDGVAPSLSLDGLRISADRTPALESALRFADAAFNPAATRAPGVFNSARAEAALRVDARAPGRSKESSAESRLAYDAADHQWLSLAEPSSAARQAQGRFDAADRAAQPALPARGARRVSQENAHVRQLAAALPRFGASSLAAAQAGATAQPALSRHAASVPVAAPVAELDQLAPRSLAQRLASARVVGSAALPRRADTAPRRGGLQLRDLVPATISTERRQAGAVARELAPALGMPVPSSLAAAQRGVTSTSPELFATAQLEAAQPRLSAFHSQEAPLTRSGEVRMSVGDYAVGFDDPTVFVNLGGDRAATTVDAALGVQARPVRSAGAASMSPRVAQQLSAITMPLSSAAEITRRVAAASTRVASAQGPAMAPTWTIASDAGERFGGVGFAAGDASNAGGTGAGDARTATGGFVGRGDVVGFGPRSSRLSATSRDVRGESPAAAPRGPSSFVPRAARPALAFDAALPASESGIDRVLGRAELDAAPALTAFDRHLASRWTESTLPQHYELGADIDAAFVRLDPTAAERLAGSHAEVRAGRVVRSVPTTARAAREALLRPEIRAARPGATLDAQIVRGQGRAIPAASSRGDAPGLNHARPSVSLGSTPSGVAPARAAVANASRSAMPALAHDRVAAVERALATFARDQRNAPGLSRLADAISSGPASARSAVAAQLATMGFDMPELLHSLNSKSPDAAALRTVERAFTALTRSPNASRLESTAATSRYFGDTAPAQLSTSTPAGRLGALMQTGPARPHAAAVAAEVGEVLRLAASGVGGSALRAADSAVLATRLAGKSTFRGATPKTEAAGGAGARADGRTPGTTGLALERPTIGAFRAEAGAAAGLSSLSERVDLAATPWARPGSLVDAIQGRFGADDRSGREAAPGATSRLAHLAPELTSLALRPKSAESQKIDAAPRRSPSARRANAAGGEPTRARATSDDGSRAFRSTGSQAVRRLLASLPGGRPLSAALPGGLELSASVVDRANGAFANMDAGIVEFLAHTASRMGGEGRELRPGFDAWPQETLDVLQQAGWGQGLSGGSEAGPSVTGAEHKVRRLERRVDAARTAWARIQDSRARRSQPQGVDAISWEMVKPVTSREAPASADLGRLASTMMRPAAAPAAEMAYVAPVVKTVAAQAQLEPKNSGTSSRSAQSAPQEGPAQAAEAAKVDYDALARQVLTRLNRRWSFERDRRGG